MVRKATPSTQNNYKELNTLLNDMEMREGMARLRDGSYLLFGLQIFWFWAYLMKFIKKNKTKKNASFALDVISTCLFFIMSISFLIN